MGRRHTSIAATHPQAALTLLRVPALLQLAAAPLASRTALLPEHDQCGGGGPVQGRLRMPAPGAACTGARGPMSCVNVKTPRVTGRRQLEHSRLYVADACRLTPGTGSSCTHRPPARHQCRPRSACANTCCTATPSPPPQVKTRGAAGCGWRRRGPGPEWHGEGGGGQQQQGRGVSAVPLMQVQQPDNAHMHAMQPRGHRGTCGVSTGEQA